MGGCPSPYSMYTSFLHIWFHYLECILYHTYTHIHACILHANIYVRLKRSNIMYIVLLHATIKQTKKFVCETRKKGTCSSIFLERIINEFNIFFVPSQKFALLRHCNVTVTKQTRNSRKAVQQFATGVYGGREALNCGVSILNSIWMMCILIERKLILFLECCTVQVNGHTTMCRKEPGVLNNRFQ